VIDEFTSVVDRTVAQIGSAALARTVRGTGRRLVAVGCHYDVIDWLQPDWMFDPAAQTFEWRCLQPRPRLRLDVVRVSAAAWPRFGAHHYLSAGLNRVARCFVALCQGRPAAFTAVLSQPGPGGGRWREHRTVCLPDFQGVGIGHALSELVAAMFRATGKRYCSVTSHPGMIAHRRRSPLWRMYRAPSLGHRTEGKHAKFNRTAALTRLTAAFEYTGPADRLSAQTLGVIE
jgi:GNAT superfamily N-acetyltransferase